MVLAQAPKIKPPNLLKKVNALSLNILPNINRIRKLIKKQPTIITASANQCAIVIDKCGDKNSCSNFGPNS